MPGPSPGSLSQGGFLTLKAKKKKKVDLSISYPVKGVGKKIVFQWKTMKCSEII